MKTEYNLSKHRFYELKHFCLQYPEWKKIYSKSDGWAEEIQKNEGDTTSRDGIRRGDLKTRMDQVEQAAALCGRFGQDILAFVTTGVLNKTEWGFPVSSNPEFWVNYRRFFWELNKIRN